MTDARQDDPHIDVRLDPAGSRFVISVDGTDAGLAAFRHEDKHWIFTHTEIDPAVEGRGLGSVLARAAIEHVQATGESVVPLCPFIRSYIERHPEFEPLVDRPATEILLRNAR